MKKVSIVGYHRSVAGLGEDARTVADLCLQNGILPELIDVAPPSLLPHDGVDRYRAFESCRSTADTVIFCLPPGEMGRVCHALAFGTAPAGRRRIGYWPWETSKLPTAFDPAFDFVDEIWASSSFLLDLYGSCGRVPVTYMPLIVTVDPPRLSPDVASLLDRHFTVLSIFDFHSRSARKNPSGAVEAFRLAFPHGTECVQLIIKTINGDKRQDDLVELLKETFEDPRIIVVDGRLPRADMCGLMTNSDIYLSLHRAEGFGRPVAEAMLLGTPVIATAWSGTADLLSEATGYPVPSRLRPVRAGEYLYASGEWAEPDVGWAASALSQLYRKPGERRTKCASALAHIRDNFSLDAVSHRFRSALFHR